MAKRTTDDSGQKNKSESKRLGLGSFEVPGVDSYARKNMRTAFIRSVDYLAPEVVSALYRSSYFQFVRLVWSVLPQSIPPPVAPVLEDKEFLADLERVIKDFSVSAPYNAETASIHPAFVELLFPSFRREPERYTDNSRGMLMRELLRPIRQVSEMDRQEFPDWAALLQIESATKLRETLTGWSQEWNMDADWCRDYAMAALREWLTNERLQWQLRWGDVALSFRDATFAVHSDDIWSAPLIETFSIRGENTNLMSLLTQGFSFMWEGLDFEAHGWNPLTSYRDEWERNCEEQFRAYLTKFKKRGGKIPLGALGEFRVKRNEYIQRIEEAALQAGLIRTPRRWAEEHIIWAVRFQVQKWPLSKIVKSYTKPRKTIADGVNRLLKFIDLNRRDNLRSGMPKGTRLQNKRRIVRN
jgi:hypothetical protein